MSKLHYTVELLLGTM